jgi:putative Ca2+/H+ antiporter (TMEM165/GDT1 family)
MHRRKTDNTMAHCFICLSSIHDLWFIWSLFYLSFFYSWRVVHLAIALSVFLLRMACGSFGHCIICLSSVLNEPQAINRRKTDNSIAK